MFLRIIIVLMVCMTPTIVMAQTTGSRPCGQRWFVPSVDNDVVTDPSAASSIDIWVMRVLVDEGCEVPRDPMTIIVRSGYGDAYHQLVYAELIDMETGDAVMILENTPVWEMRAGRPTASLNMIPVVSGLAGEHHFLLRTTYRSDVSLADGDLDFFIYPPVPPTNGKIGIADLVPLGTVTITPATVPAAPVPPHPASPYSLRFPDR